MSIVLRLALILLPLAAPAAAAEAKAAAAFPKAAADPVRPESSDKTYEQLSFLVDVISYIQENYVDPADTQKLVYGAAAGMVRELDPFSQFMQPQEHREIKAETEGAFGGIGIRMILKDDWLTVLTPLPGTPAYRSGMLPNDRIIEIDGETSKDLQVADAMEKLRGAPGSKVKLTVMRWPEPAGGAKADAVPGEDGVRKEFSLTRESIKIESVQYRKLAGQVGYVRIAEFSARTMADFREAMRALTQDSLAGLVLDLRFNPGGLLAAAVDVAASFLGEGKLIVYTQGRRPDSHQEFRAGTQAPYQDLPLVVLVNEASASGSEIIAGALQDHRRALIMGSRTYGKASVQSVIPLPGHCGLRLTVARYYTPNGRSIQRDEKKKTGGITPDTAVQVAREVEEKIYAQWELIYEPGKKPRSAVKKDEAVRDEVLDRAVALIQARDVLGRLKGKEK
ncbi:MAG: S41 family peptidase [Elusimicrobia bacterium]|nr:S41 family peptidase [Elusimicrobiota bacterium]